jgi:colicin import membrane protein
MWSWGKLMEEEASLLQQCCVVAEATRREAEADAERARQAAQALTDQCASAAAGVEAAREETDAAKQEVEAARQEADAARQETLIACLEAEAAKQGAEERVAAAEDKAARSRRQTAEAVECAEAAEKALAEQVVGEEARAAALVAELRAARAECVAVREEAEEAMRLLAEVNRQQQLNRSCSEDKAVQVDVDVDEAKALHRAELEAVGVQLVATQQRCAEAESRAGDLVAAAMAKVGTVHGGRRLADLSL